MKLRLLVSTSCLAAGIAAMTLPAAAEPASQTLKERQAKILNVVQQNSKTVVGIAGIGSGVIVSKDGLILTAAHVVDAFDMAPRQAGEDRKNEFEVILPNGTIVKAKALGRNRSRDAALAQITTPGEYAYSEIAAPDSIKQGQWVVAMGHPGGFQVDRAAPVRAGRLWQKNDDAFFRSDCTISGGDSGGPLFDLDGKVIGIHSSIAQGLEENRHVPIGVYHQDMERMKAGEKWGKLSHLDRIPKDLRETPRNPQKPSPKTDHDGGYLGVLLGKAQDSGVQVLEVLKHSPAEQAGLLPNDVILAANGKKTPNADALVAIVSAAKAGTELALTVRREGQEKTLEVTLGKRP